MPSKSKAKAVGTKNGPKTSGTKSAADTDPINPSSSSTAGPKGVGDSQSTTKAVSAEPTNQPSRTPVSQPVLEYASNPVAVNRKKQKRRLKEAAKRAAGQPPMTDSELARQFADVAESTYQDIIEEMAAAKANGEEANGYDYGASDYGDPDQYDPDEVDDIYYTDEANGSYPAEYAPAAPRTNGYTPHNHDPHNPLGGGKKKKTARAGGMPQTGYSAANSMPLSTQPSLQRPPPPPPPPATQSAPRSASHSTPHVSKDRIWNTSTAEERERIKEFWLSLGEEDRRSLVKVEKEAVLKKMKEQQKHSCSCTVCGRKRTAIEEELEVLYDAYYVELEQYANHQQISLEDGTPIIPPPRMYGHPMTRIPPGRHPHLSNGRSPRGRIQEVGDEDAVDEEEYSDEEEEDDLSDEEDSEATGPAGDFFNFGNSLTVQGGILTVADDLLKNDGKKFIEMMEQLAERRMQREEEAQMTAAGMGHPSMHHGPPEDDDGFDDEEDDEEYDSQEDDEFDDEEVGTEEQRMEEGRRMFQIFAARMFEQRVLTAYREKVALERQQKLIEELDDESRVDAQREAKKAKEAQKKKEKKRLQKQARDEERAKREAEKAAEEAAAKASEEKKAEEQRRKREEQRRKREAEKKALEEDRQRKESEKQKQMQERKEQQAEQERKQKEQKEREKRKREETKKKDRDEREAREKEAREKKERETEERREREAKTKAENEARERSKKEDAVVQQAQSAPKRPSPANVPSAVTPVIPGFNPPLTTSSHASPRPFVATPVLPKAPTPVRARQSSFQESRNTSPKNSQPPSASSTASPATSTGHQAGVTAFRTRNTSQSAPIQPAQPHAPYSPLSGPPGSISQPPGFPSQPTISGGGFPSPFGPPMSPVISQVPHNPALYPNQALMSGGQYRNIMPPNTMPFSPTMNGMRQFPPSRPGAMDPPIAQGPIGAPPHVNTDFGHFGMSRDAVPSHSHSRNTSTSSNVGAGNPIARPAPIQRPSSVAPHQQNERANMRPSNGGVDELSHHLGSSALIDDTDLPLSSLMNDPRGGSMAVGGPRGGRQGFGVAPGYQEPIGMPRTEPQARSMQSNSSNAWPGSQSTFGAPPKHGSQPWSNPPGFGWPANNNGFGTMNGPSRPGGGAPRELIIRTRVCQACEKLTSRSPQGPHHGWHNTQDVLNEVNLMAPPNEAVSLMEMLGIADTEGNTQNGGGTFELKPQEGVGLVVKHHTGRTSGLGGNTGVPGDIGSPIVGGGAMPAIGGPRSFQQPGGFPTAMGF